MSETYVVDSTLYMTPAFAGMLADVQFTSKETHPAAGTISFGMVVTPAADGKVSAGGTGVNGGVAIADHTVAGVYQASQYRQYDPVSVLRRGRIWGLASGTCTKDAVAKYASATGIFLTAGNTTLKNARFRSANISFPGLPGDAAQILVLVELHDPGVDDIGAS